MNLKYKIYIVAFIFSFHILEYAVEPNPAQRRFNKIFDRAKYKFLNFEISNLNPKHIFAFITYIYIYRDLN